MKFFSFDTKFNLKVISIFSLAVAMIYVNAPFFEGEPEPDFSRFMSHLIYLEENGSTILYSDGKSDANSDASIFKFVEYPRDGIYLNMKLR